MDNKFGAIPLSNDIFDKSNIGLWAFELDEGLPPRMYVDDTMLKLIGLEHQVSPEETYHAWYDHIDPEHYNEVTEAVEKMSAGTHAEVQYPWHHPNGTTMIVRCGGVRNYKYTNGLRIEGCHQDVTAMMHIQKKLEAELVQTRVFTKFFVDTYVSAYYIGLDDLTCEVYKRDAYLAQRYPIKTNFKDSLDEYINNDVHPEDRQIMLEMSDIDYIRNRLKREPEFATVIRDISCGKLKYYRFQVIRGADENHAAFGFADITEEINAKFQREKLEQDQIDRLMALMGDFQAVYDVDLNTLNYKIFVGNKSFNDTVNSNYTTGENIFKDIYSDVEVLVYSEDRHLFYEKFTLEYITSELNENGELSYDYRSIYDGKPVWHNFKIVRSNNPLENRIYIGIFDIQNRRAEEKRQQEMLEESRQKACLASEAKTRFLFNMSHDIRTPMNAIMGFNNMALRNIDNKEKTIDCLQKVDKASNLLLSLINDILDMSRIESGKVEIVEIKSNVNQVFSNIELMMQELASKKNVNLSFEIKNIKDNYVLLDLPRVERILVNIISNGIKYNKPNGYVKVLLEQIGFDNLANEANYRFTIADNGIGMSKEFQAHLFEEFSRETSSSISGIQGTGLGLSLAKALVNLMRGNIRCVSAKGVGSSFIIDLPFKLCSNEDISKPKSLNIIGNAPLAKKNILLVEDNEMNREIAMDMLMELGGIIVSAVNGLDAIKTLSTYGPDYFDFILMDIQMPVMDGYQATKEIRKLYKRHIPIIALSANAFEEDKKKSLEAGMDDHVAKPIKEHELEEALTRIINK